MLTWEWIVRDYTDKGYMKYQALGYHTQHMPVYGAEGTTVDIDQRIGSLDSSCRS